MSQTDKPVRPVGLVGPVRPDRPVRPSTALTRRELFRGVLRWSGAAALLGLVGWRGLRSAARNCDPNQFPTARLCAGCWIADSCSAAMVPQRDANEEAEPR